MKKSSAVWLIISLVLSACSLMAFKSIETNGLHNVVGAETQKSLYKSYNFLDGGDSTDQYYSHTNQTTNVSYASDNPGETSGTTAWEADYANFALAYSTRLGGKKHLPNKRMTLPLGATSKQSSP